MEHALTLETTDSKFLISIDKNYIEQDFLIGLMSHIRLEYLAKKVDFDDSIESLAEEIKTTWWDKNKTRLLKHQL